jgi:hypothetical protein
MINKKTKGGTQKKMTCEKSRQLQAQHLTNNYSDLVLFSVY